MRYGAVLPIGAAGPVPFEDGNIEPYRLVERRAAGQWT